MKVTLIKGDGIGPEICDSMEKILKVLGSKVEFEEVNAGASVFEKEKTFIPDRVFKSIEKNKIAIKGPITTPIGHGFRSINVELRKKYDLFANIRPIKSIKNINTKYENVDMVIFRENTEDLYIGLEEKISDDEFHSIKVITRKKSERIIKSAFDYAQKFNRKKVTIVTKANIMKFTDGLFLNVGREISKSYPKIEFEELLVDNTAMQMVQNPNKFDVIVTENLYGDILSDLAAGLVGGLGLVPGVNKGEEISIYESVHGSAPDIAGKNLANPIAILLTASLMLDDIGEENLSKKLRLSIEKTMEDKKNHTRDLKGEASLDEITQAIIKNLGDDYE